MNVEHWKPTFKAIEATPHKILGVVLAKSEDSSRVGTACRVHRVQVQEGKLQVLVELLQRFRIEQITGKGAPFSAQVRYLPEPATGGDTDIKAYAMAVINTTRIILRVRDRLLLTPGNIPL